MTKQFQADFWECGFLKDSTTELKKHELLASKNIQVFKKRFEQTFEKISDCLNLENWNRHQTECLANMKKFKRERDVALSKVSSLENQNNQLNSECSELRQRIAEVRNDTIDKAEELKQKRDEELCLAQDAMRKRTNMRNELNALKVGKAQYKNLLNVHVRFEADNENGEIFIITFESDKHLNSAPPNSVKFLLVKMSSWKLLEVSPPLSNFNQLSRKLDESQDTQGLLVYLNTLMTGNNIK